MLAAVEAAQSTDPPRPVPLAFVSSSGEHGGAESLMLSILDGLPPGWIQLVIFLGDGPVAEEVRRRGHRTVVIASARRWSLMRAARPIRRMLRESGATVVHANGVRAAFTCALATLGSRMQVVWLKVDSSRDGKIARLLARRCALVVGISHTVNAGFRGRLRDRLRVVYPGLPARTVDREAAHRLVRRLTGCAHDASVVVVAARLTPTKGQADLLECVRDLRSARPEIHIVLLGGEAWPWHGYEAVLRSRIRELGIDDSVSLLGHRPPGIEGGEDVLRFIAGSDLLAAPSRYEPESGWREGFGYAPLEAMSVGTPVVAYNHGSFPEVLGECARFVPEGDTSALTIAILEVLGDERLARRLVACGAERVKSYPLEATIAGMTDAYREVAYGATGDDGRRGGD